MLFESGTLIGNIVFLWKVCISIDAKGSSEIALKSIIVNTVFVSPHQLLVQNAKEVRKVAGAKKCKSKTYDQLYVMKGDMALEILQVGGSGKMDKDGAMILFAVKSDSLIDAAAEQVEIDDESLFLIADELLFEDDVGPITASQHRF